MTFVDALVAAACAAAVAVGSLRWLRIAQREHYIGGSVIRFAGRWWRARPEGGALVALAATATVVALWAPAVALATAAVVMIAPLGLSLRGRTSKLAWTRRLRTVAIATAVLDAAVIALARGRVAAFAAVALAQPVLVDVALAALSPIERRLAGRYVKRATSRLREVTPTVVAITGSYGKTSTKVLARHLVAGARTVVASPASFNNAAGLSRTINEQLAPGTEVLLAEMGMYRAGEIASLCSWLKPSIGVITAIGPVHLERMKTLDAIVAAKREIVADAPIAVLNIDAHGITAVADELAAQGRTVIRCSTRPGADVWTQPTDGGITTVFVGARALGPLTDEQPLNAAVAVGIALALGVDPDVIAARLPSLPRAEHRQEVSEAASGVVVIDNTFSSNPASVTSSLDLLARRHRPDHRAVVVTPGMVELGQAQADENERFGRATAAVATDLAIVGRTNRAALERGAAAGGDRLRVHRFAHREDAVRWVRAELAPGDVVLYENDLPDHYP